MNNIVYNEDCRPFMKKYPDKFFELVIVDPPYFSGPSKLGYYGKNISRTKVRRKSYENEGNWVIPDDTYFSELMRISQNQIIWGINYYPIFNPGPGRVVWDKVNDKSNFSNCEIAYCSYHESVCIFRYVEWDDAREINFGGYYSARQQAP